MVAMACEPGRHSELGIAVRGSGVDVVHAVLEEELERPIRLSLGDRGQCGGAEDRARALVACLPERRRGDHGF